MKRYFELKEEMVLGFTRKDVGNIINSCFVSNGFLPLKPEEKLFKQLTALRGISFSLLKSEIKKYLIHNYTYSKGLFDSLMDALKEKLIINKNLTIL